METSTIANRSPDLNKRRKIIKTQQQRQSQDSTGPHKTQWKSETTQQLYSSKLLRALRHVRISPATRRRGRAVREAADRLLAVAARGRTRWSRTILGSRLRVKCFNKNHKRRTVTGDSRFGKKPRVGILKLKGRDLPTVQRKVKKLGRLVPGCRKEVLPVILEEATDYIPALEMQIRAMREILSRLSAIAPEGSGSPTPSRAGNEGFRH